MNWRRAETRHYIRDFYSGTPRNYNSKLLDTSNYRIVRSLSSARFYTRGRGISRWCDFDREKSDLVVYADFPIQEFDYTADPSALAAGTSLAVGLYPP